jgi:hypothetical protein
MTRTTPTAQTTDLLKEVAFLLAMTQKVKDGMSRPTPPAAPAVKPRRRLQAA